MPDRTEVFNLRDCDVALFNESAFGVKGSSITSYLLYVDSAKLTNRRKVNTATMSGAVGSRPTTVMDDYHLSLNRFHAKNEEDFAVFIDPTNPTKTYAVDLIFTNEDNPSLTETYELSGCQLTGRALTLNGIVNNVSLDLFVAKYVKS